MRLAHRSPVAFVDDSEAGLARSRTGLTKTAIRPEGDRRANGKFVPRARRRPPPTTLSLLHVMLPESPALLSRVSVTFATSRPPSPTTGHRSFRGETASRFRFGNEDEPRMNTNRHYGWSSAMTSGARMLLQYCDVGVTTSWEKAPQGARASRPHLGIASPISLPRIERQIGRASLCFGPSPMRFPPAGGAGCRIAGKLSGNPRDSMRARRPRSRGVLSRWCAGGYPAGDFSESRPAPFGKLPFVREPCPRPAVRIKPECNNQKSTIPS